MPSSGQALDQERAEQHADAPGGEQEPGAAVTGVEAVVGEDGQHADHARPEGEAHVRSQQGQDRRVAPGVAQGLGRVAGAAACRSDRACLTIALHRRADAEQEQSGEQEAAGVGHERGVAPEQDGEPGPHGGTDGQHRTPRRRHHGGRRRAGPRARPGWPPRPGRRGAKNAPRAVTPPWATNTIHGSPAPASRKVRATADWAKDDDDEDGPAVEAVRHRTGDGRDHEGGQALGHPEQRRQQIGAGLVEEEADGGDGGEPVARVADELGTEEATELRGCDGRGTTSKASGAPAGGSDGPGAGERHWTRLVPVTETGTATWSGPDWTRTSDLFRVEEAL